MTGEESRRRRRARWLWVSGSAGVAVVLFVAYLRLSRTYAATSDGADQALQGWDMLHGNLLLHGWTMGDVTYYTTEIPEYALVEVFRGLRGDVVHIAGAATYTLLVLAAGLLARGRARGREGLVRLAVASGIMLAPQFGNATHLLLSQPDHLGTQLPLLLVFLMLDRAPRRWYVPVAAGVALAWVVIADRVAVLDAATARAGLRCPCPAGGISPASAAGRKSLASQWFELSLVAASAVVRRGHARRAADRRPARVPGHPGEVGDAGMRTIFRAIGVTLEGILNIYGADFVHLSNDAPFGPDLGGLPMAAGVALAAVHLVGVALAVWGLFRAFRYFFDPDDLVSPVLATAIVVNVAAYSVSIVSGGLFDAREILAVLPFGAVLAGRMVPGTLGRPLAAAAQAGAGVRLGGRAGLLPGRARLRGRPVTGGGQRAGGHSVAGGAPPHQRDRHLRRGEPHHDGQRGPRRGQGSSVAVLRRCSAVLRVKGVLVRPRAKLCQLHPDQQRRALRHDGGGPGIQIGLISGSAIAALHAGPPAHVYHYKTFTIMVWNHNLLDNLDRNPYFQRAALHPRLRIAGWRARAPVMPVGHVVTMAALKGSRSRIC